MKQSKIMENYYLDWSQLTKRVYITNGKNKKDVTEFFEKIVFDMNIKNKSFWSETARLIDEYRKEGNEERVQGIVDCRILFNRCNTEIDWDEVYEEALHRSPDAFDEYVKKYKH